MNLVTICTLSARLIVTENWLIIQNTGVKSHLVQVEQAISIASCAMTEAIALPEYSPLPDTLATPLGLFQVALITENLWKDISI